MDQVKIGGFIKELRKEKGITQEQLAEQLNTSRRTVSRWETGSNLPDLDVLVELADYFEVEIRELFDGERRNTEMTVVEETVMKAAEYTNAEKQRLTKVACIYYILGFISLIAHEIMLLMDIGHTFWTGLAEGATFGMAMASMIIGILYTTGYLTRISESKKRIVDKFVDEEAAEQK